MPTLRPPQSGDKKLPPADLPEHRLFSLLQRARRPLMAWLDVQHSQGSVAPILNEIVRIALRSPAFECGTWKREGSGRFVASHAELQLDLQSAEVLWRNDDLRPIPDSMSQFGDYESLFHGESLHCGLVSRQQHRHWVHVVGTPYDLVEWDEPSPSDLGVGCPVAAPAPTPPARKSAAQNLSALLGFAEDQCILALAETGDDEENAASLLLANGGRMPSATPAARESAPAAMDEDEDEYSTPPGLRLPMQTRRRVQAVAFADACNFGGEVFDRHFDFYEKSPRCGLPEAEGWVSDLLSPILNELFPEDDPQKKISYKLLLPRDPILPTATCVRLMGCADADKEGATWKELVCWRSRNIVHIFNLVSHGRHTYRTLIFTSDSRFTLGILPLNLGKGSPISLSLLYQAGSIRVNRVHDSSLVVLRRNPKIGGHERFLPKILMMGILPSALLDNYHFWMGEDGRIRSEMIDAQSQWFGYDLEVHFSRSGKAVVRRHPPGVACSRVENPTEKVTEATMLVRQTSHGRPEQAGVTYSDTALASLSQLGFSLAAVKLALRECNQNLSRAAAWLVDDRHAEDIRACEQEPEEMDVDAPTNVTEVQILVDQGFPRAACQVAMDMFKQTDAAAAWLADEKNRDKIMAIEKEVGSDVALPRSVSLQRAASITGEQQGDLMLFNLLEAPEGSMLFRLASVLARIEDLSYVLVWTTSSSLTEEAQISFVELPRLKLKFQPQRCADGLTRLFMTDRAGWFVSDVCSSGRPVAPLLAALLGNISHSLVCCIAAAVKYSMTVEILAFL